MNIPRKSAALIFLLASMTVAQADLLSISDAEYGAGSVTLDTETGLEWLDLTASVGLSIDDVFAGAGGFIDNGWSIARGTQVDELFYNAGATDLGVFNTLLGTQDNEAYELLIQTLGFTDSYINSQYPEWGELKSGIGLTYNVEPQCSGCPGLGLVSSPFYLRQDPSAVTITGSGYWGWDADLTTAHSFDNTGIYLIRRTAPEPGMLGLLVIGLAGMGLVRRRKRV